MPVLTISRTSTMKDVVASVNPFTLKDSVQWLTKELIQLSIKRNKFAEGLYMPTFNYVPYGEGHLGVLTLPTWLGDPPFITSHEYETKQQAQNQVALMACISLQSRGIFSSITSQEQVMNTSVANDEIYADNKLSDIVKLKSRKSTEKKIVNYPALEEPIKPVVVKPVVVKALVVKPVVKRSVVPSSRRRPGTVNAKNTSTPSVVQGTRPDDLSSETSMEYLKCICQHHPELRDVELGMCC